MLCMEYLPSAELLEDMPSLNARQEKDCKDLHCRVSADVPASLILITNQIAGSRSAGPGSFEACQIQVCRASEDRGQQKLVSLPFSLNTAIRQDGSVACSQVL